jgi:hypothetical protein
MSVTILENFINLDEINVINEYYKNQEFENRGFHPEYKDKLQWENTNIASWIWEDILDEKVTKLFNGAYTVSAGCGKFQRCYIPFGMHMDSKPKHTNDNLQFSENWKTEGNALLIPLNEGIHLHTVFWNKHYHTIKEQNNDFLAFARLPINQTKSNGIGETYDLEFAWADKNKKLYSHLEVDDVFEWKLGNAATWGRNQLHASTNFATHIAYKDCLTIFFE